MLPVGKLDVQVLPVMIQRVGLAILVTMVVIAGCTIQGPAPPADLQRLELEARSQANAGNLDLAAQLYSRLVAASTGTQQVDFLTAGASVLIDSGNYGTARRWLMRARDAASPAQQPLVLVLLAEVEVAEGRPEPALELVGLIGDPPTDALITAVAGVRGRALFGLGQAEEAVAVLVERELWLDDPQEILENHRFLWDGLAAQAAGTPYAERGDPIVDGWLALAPVAAAYRNDPLSLQRGLAAWSETYPNHPAAGRLIAELLAQARLTREYPEQIALLLPLSSPQQAAARAIRDGFIAAQLRIPGGRRARIKIYDTGILGTQEAYLRAQIEGADFIVGPLMKIDVENIIGSAGFVPTLALNSVDTQEPLPPGFFQFALAPEDEAREVARHAVASGARNALALIPNSDWGLRLLASFRAELEALGGQLLQWRGYDPQSQDFSVSITTLMNISRSNQRYQRLAANLGVPLEFEPRRRQDVDMIFVAADAPTGRALAPQLRFHYAGDIPTYATSAVYEPGSRTSDSDLDGILFPDTPWLLLPDDASESLRLALESYWPQRASRWIRLYGMGFDAHRLVPMLYGQPAQFTAITAMSGELSLDAEGRVRRRLPVAQFRNGVPVALGVGESPQQEDPPPESTELAELR